MVSSTPTRMNSSGVTWTSSRRQASIQSRPASDPVGTRRGPRSPPMSAARNGVGLPRRPERHQIDERHGMVVERGRADGRRRADVRCRRPVYHDDSKSVSPAFRSPIASTNTAGRKTSTSHMPPPWPSSSSGLGVHARPATAQRRAGRDTAQIADPSKSDANGYVAATAEGGSTCAAGSAEPDWRNDGDCAEVTDARSRANSRRSME